MMKVEFYLQYTTPEMRWMQRGSGSWRRYKYAVSALEQSAYNTRHLDTVWRIVNQAGEPQYAPFCYREKK